MIKINKRTKQLVAAPKGVGVRNAEASGSGPAKGDEDRRPLSDADRSVFAEAPSPDLERGPQRIGTEALSQVQLEFLTLLNIRWIIRFPRNRLGSDEHSPQAGEKLEVESTIARQPHAYGPFADPFCHTTVDKVGPGSLFPQQCWRVPCRRISPWRETSAPC